MPARAWTWSFLALLLSACGNTLSSPVLVAPSLPTYTPEVQERAIEELEELGPACPRNRAVPGCSALKLFTDDYGDLRAKLRAMEGDQ
jgi:hypothetical protein